MGKRKPLILPGEEICGCVPEKPLAGVPNMFVFVCPCMYTQNESGDIVCNICKGDIYACECLVVHSTECEMS